MAGTATPTVTLQTGPETGTKVADFTSPANLIRNTTRNYTFTPDSPVTLAPSTQYWVVMEEGTTAVNPRITLEEGEDDTPVDGATMGNAAYHRFKNETGDFRLYTVQDQVVALGVRGVRFNALATGTVVAAAPNVFRVPAVLSADLSGIADANGVTGIASTATYTWQRLDAHGTTLEAADIGTGSTYSLTDADAGKRFRVVVSFRDDDGYAEGPFTSAATAAITAAAETCAPTLTGGATLVWTGTVPIRAAPSSYGFMASESDSLSNPTFTVGSNTYTVDAVVARTDGRLFLSLDKALTTDDRTGLAFHACRAPLDLLSATHVASGFHYIWGNSGVNWSSHAERTVHLTEDSAKPTFVEARVNGTSLVITFNEELGTAGSLANSAFAGKKTPDGGSETDLTFSTTTAPSISGRTVTLTLASTSAVSATDEDVKISYTKPTTGTANKIVDVVSNEADSFTDEEVINELADQVPPELATTGAAVLAADGVTLTLTFNEPLKTTSVPDEDAFTVEATPAGGVEAEVDLASTTPVTVDGSTVVLKLAVAITHNDTDVKVSYETPTSGAVIEDTNANDAADITDQTVTNNSEAPRVSIEAIYDDATPVMAYPEFRVTRSIASTSALTVNIEFTQDEAYVHSTTTTVTIPANQTTQSQEVFISSSHQLTSGDFTATVAAGAGYAPAVTPDDSDTVAIKIPTPAIAGSAFPETAISVDEGESVDVQVDINIYPGAARPKRQNSISGVLFQAQTATISVDYTHISRSFSPSTSDWTASSDGGYTAMDIFTVQTVEDEVYEGDETFTVTFTAVPGAPSLHIPTGSGTLTISGGNGSEPHSDAPRTVGTEQGRILAVGGDPEGRRYVRNILLEAAFTPVVTNNPDEMERLIEVEKPHLVIVESMHFRGEGLALLERIRSVSDAPVVFVSGRGSGHEIERAFELGAADYVVKPFTPTELVARINAALRRGQSSTADHALETFMLEDMTIDYGRRLVTVAGHPVQLTATEYKLLSELSTAAGQVLTYEQLLRRAWGPLYSGDTRIVHTYVKQLRRKLGDDAKQPRYIFTEPRVGYHMAKPAAD